MRWLGYETIFDYCKVKVHIAECLNWMKKQEEEEEEGWRWMKGGVKWSYDFRMCHQNAPGEATAGHTCYAQRISIFRMHRGWGPRLRLQSPCTHNHFLDFRARLSAAQKKSTRTKFGMSIWMLLDESSKQILMIIAQCQFMFWIIALVFVSQWPPVCTISVKDWYAIRVDLLIALRSGTLRSL